MGSPDEFDSRLKAYLQRGASTPQPVGMEARILGGRPRRKVDWVLQVAAAAAVLVLAIGLGIVLQRARQSNGDHPFPPATALASPSIKPTPYPTPTTSGAAYPLLPPASMHMIDRNTGWAAGSGTNRILRTADGGSHWVDVTPSVAKAGTWITYFLDANKAWLGSSVQPGSGSPDFSVAIYRTTDGGRSWQHVGQVGADQGWPGSIDFVDAAHGWLVMNLGSAAGSQGVALYGTVDGGTTWTKLSEADTSGNAGQLPLSCSKRLPVFLNSSTGWIPGSCSAGGGPFFYVTRDSGATWTDVRLALPTGWAGNCMCQISSLRFSDARNAVFVLTAYASDGLPQSVLYSTSDAGNSWRPGPVMPDQTYEVWFIDPMHGWTMNAKTNSLLATSDGGKHWSMLGPIPSTQAVMGFQFVTTQIGWALASEPRGEPIVKTSDGGRTWTTQLAP